jgi:hemolysin activation/secretion protein
MLWGDVNAKNDENVIDEKGETMRRLGVQTITRALIVFSLVVPLSTNAQFRPPDAGTILDTVKDPKAPKRPDQGLPVSPPPRPRMEAPPGIKVMVKAFRISGNTLFTEAEIQATLVEFLNKELDFEGLSEVVRTVTSFYRGRGYFLAQAYLPKQELTDGIVEVFVLEGRVGKVELKMKPNARLRPWVAQSFLNRIEEGTIAQERTLERPLLLLGDLPSVTVESTIGPGAGVGEADLTVEIGDDGRRVSGVVEVENFGQKFAGETRIGGQLFVNNPLGLGDLLTFRGLAAQDLLTEVMGVSYALPVTPWGTKFGLNYSQMRYRLGGSLALAGAAGEAELASALLVHPIVRTRELNVFGQLSADLKDLEDRVDSAFLVEERRIKGWKLGIFGDSRDLLFGGGLNTFSVTYTDAKLKLGIETRAIDVTQFETEGNFSKVNVDARRVQRITAGLHGVVKYAGQSASKNLTSAEKMSVGGPYAVRAYPVGEGLADEAHVATAELRYTVPGVNVLNAGLTVIGFIDGAHVKRFKNPNPTVDVDPLTGNPNPNTRTLWGAGFGFRFGKEGDFTLAADFAWRAGNEPPQSDVGRNPRVWLYGAKWF